ncbi:aminoglycoside phosphotransferase family protein [Solirubrobacter phytolaccae]|uniref:Aminoglycoside phosphotransferase family protein n=1 Tax=Solirubrobacter phytolaccae TaxID=1404360 RepID=A0A9X3N892_9ACTN|nr:phosphotransferase [Solirubrobacter phytolaccae]MDA0181558.1 aminoglycoside phosphotransferase family protein [Solirubrobacter phytolaccae]
MARVHGLKVEDPIILRDQLNVLVHLRPAPVVARVAGTITRARRGTTWQERELSVAGHLARAGAPVVAPSAELPPGPHVHNGRVLSFWDYAPPADAVDPAAAGEALAQCHEALRSYGGSLPLLGTITEAEAVLARLAAEETIDPDTATTLLLRIHELVPMLTELRSPVQPLHGDAHLGNVLGGPLWNDWEDTCLGPVGWDAACLLAGRHGRERQEAAYAASRMGVDPGELNLWIEARSLQVTIWRWVR